jgi:hypothetical protein
VALSHPNSKTCRRKEKFEPREWELSCSGVSAGSFVYVAVQSLEKLFKPEAVKALCEAPGNTYECCRKLISRHCAFEAYNLNLLL